MLIYAYIYLTVFINISDPLYNNNNIIINNNNNENSNNSEKQQIP